MDNEIKKDLASNWFKLLQDAICDNIKKLEKNKIKLENCKLSYTKNINQVVLNEILVKILDQPNIFFQ